MLLQTVNLDVDVVVFWMWKVEIRNKKIVFLTFQIFVDLYHVRYIVLYITVDLHIIFLMKVNWS
jgi:hypothetical protein